jgi:5-methylcytosine-specific restriction endonuclease McrA
MMQLTRPDCPEDLTTERAALLRSHFLADNSLTVWEIRSVKAALLAMSFNKCCYCEANLVKQSMYMEVNHFLCKKLYPEKVVDWTNLLPACKHCNTTKGDHDTDRKPIVDPSSTDPRRHLTFVHYWFKGADDIGRETVEVLDLNDWYRNTTQRIKVGKLIHDFIGNLCDDLAKYEAIQTARTRNKVLRRLRQLLEEAGPESEYCSTAATILMVDPDFGRVKAKLLASGLWDERAEILYRAAQAIAYAPRP